MENPIPEFDHNHVLPPHLGDPRYPHEQSPYRCTTYDLCVRFGTSDERKSILLKYLDFRKQVEQFGLIGIQWLGGSFLENVEILRNRAPKDLDLVTFFWAESEEHAKRINRAFPPFSDPCASKARFQLDHFPVDINPCNYPSPFAPTMLTTYWTGLFMHTRKSVWKGMLQIPLNTPDDDKKAASFLKGEQNNG